MCISCKMFDCAVLCWCRWCRLRPLSCRLNGFGGSVSLPSFFINWSEICVSVRVRVCAYECVLEEIWTRMTRRPIVYALRMLNTRLKPPFQHFILAWALIRSLICSLLIFLCLLPVHLISESSLSCRSRSLSLSLPLVRFIFGRFFLFIYSHLRTHTHTHFHFFK